MTDLIVGRKPRRRKDFTGRKFGKLTAEKFSRFSVSKCGRKKEIWFFRCDCGTMVEYARSNILTKRCNSCGCLRVEAARKRQVKHGFACHPSIYGKGRHKFYMAWYGMIQRLRHPTYARRGIKIEDPRWMKFMNFMEDMFPTYIEGLQLDRRDNDRGYFRDNCRWVTRKVNMNNTSKTRYIFYKGEKIALSLLAERCGLKPCTLYTRIKRGWSVDKAVEQPKGNYSPKIVTSPCRLSTAD